MNFEKSKVLLKKINALYEAADEELGVSALEKDLMLQYVRDFYEAIKENSRGSAIRREEVSTIRQELQAPSVQPILRQNTLHAQPIAAQPIVPTPSPVISEPFQEAKISEELSLLFIESENEESRSRYSAGKITDIGRSMGINDKILTINDLFKGDQTLFNKTIDHLNSLVSYDKAKTYLATGVAENFNWADASKKGKAVRFINLMRRRYSA
ncbi:MAG: hypothetical protein ACI9FN_003681 [Saprospiraceae bacterium]|jgi:hypothetical protein